MEEIKKTILLVEDDLRLSRLVREYLEKQGYEILLEHHGALAGDRILGEDPDLVILDLMLPGKDGLSICRDVRANYQGPILILTAKEDDMDQVAGLELGADDYVKKPVEPRVLLARIRALFRRSSHVPMESKNSIEKKLQFGSLEINPASRSVKLAHKVIELSTTEFDLLCLLALKSGKVLDREFLYQSVKGIEYDGIDRSMDVAISRLRKKLKDNPEHPFRIKTVWGSGYLFVDDAWDYKPAP
ncbi:two component system response regulator [Desulfobacula toluolica Tol2]|uniref:Two component system response regulator n=3 Tax=Desulfobacteraceae TaxID=213119 RepID=K0NCM5_DESTT|nr:two component system response regulator [Desulfobacula toluolica Tol2]SDT89747.1 two-component system, OmpR family, response regulator RstA [Desulfobacula phenolica]